jgi:2-phosphosulfolactate phosphatase
MGNNIETVLSPALLHLYDVKGKTVVAIDILRATTTICVAFQHGVKRILPVATPEEAKFFKDFDFLTAAERNAIKVDGFDLGNSPFEYQNPLLENRSIAFTTTNGTKAIKKAKAGGASHILIGSFLNIDAVCKRLVEINAPIILLCAGWKDRFNLEDTLYAGAIAYRLKSTHPIECDSTAVAMQLYENNKHKLAGLAKTSTHAKRFEILHMQTDDVSFCMQENIVNIVPELVGEYIIIP